MQNILLQNRDAEQQQRKKYKLKTNQKKRNFTINLDFHRLADSSLVNIYTCIQRQLGFGNEIVCWSSFESSNLLFIQFEQFLATCNLLLIQIPKTIVQRKLFLFLCRAIDVIHYWNEIHLVYLVLVVCAKKWKGEIKFDRTTKSNGVRDHCVLCIQLVFYDLNENGCEEWGNRRNYIGVFR